MFMQIDTLAMLLASIITLFSLDFFCWNILKTSVIHTILFITWMCTTITKHMYTKLFSQQSCVVKDNNATRSTGRSAWHRNRKLAINTSTGRVSPVHGGPLDWFSVGGHTPTKTTCNMALSLRVRTILLALRYVHPKSRSPGDF